MSVFNFSSLFSKKRKRLVVYTAIFDNYDELKEPSKQKKCDFVLFTDDKNLKSERFKIILKERLFDDPTRDARMYKILPHKFLDDYDYSLWVDGSFQIKDVDLFDLVEKYLNDTDLATFAHPERDCIYDEANVCIAMNKDAAYTIKHQAKAYLAEGYPPHFGLIASGVILRKHSKAVADFDDSWWSQIQKYSKRDQLSFNYVVWKNKFKFSTIDGSIWDNLYFKFQSHKK